MSFADLLINKVTIKRWTDGGADSYGNPTKVPVVPDPYIDQPCRLSYPKGRQLQTATEVVPITEMLFLEDIDITEADRAEVDGITYEILFVARRQDSKSSHHLELDLQRVIP